MSKITILSNFKDFNLGYSLIGIAHDQVLMLREFGHEVNLLVDENFKDDLEFTSGVIAKAVMPSNPELIDYKSRHDLTEDHRAFVEKLKTVFVEELSDSDFVFTHDFVFTGWNMPYAIAIQESKYSIDKPKWLHWVHSIPSQQMNWRNIRFYNHNHKIVFPNKTDKVHVAEEFKAKPRHVKVIPHIKDLRTWFEFGKGTCDFIAEFPDIMTSDVVQVYPASSDRLSSKGVNQIILLLSKMKRMGFSVFLLIANQWAHGRGGIREDTEKYMRIAKRNGLRMYEDFMFTSEYNSHYELGLPKRMLRELFQCSNLFVFPTQGESFGLIGPEAALAGGVLLVLNRSLPMMTEVYGHTGLYFDFGSLADSTKDDKSKKYYDAMAALIINRMMENESLMSKTYVRKKYNWYNIYNKYYEPVMAESEIW